MTRLRLAALSLSLAGIVGVALVGSSAPDSTGSRMTDAANKFLTSLTPEQKKKVSFGFDDPHRTKWYFTPQQTKDRKYTRKGVPLEEMTAEQKKAAMELLKSGLSAKGYEQATTIIGLEGLLAELEGGKGAMVRNPNWYFVSVFGEPSNTGKWGWRVEGHHLSVNYTLDKGEVVSGAPMLFAANPAEVKDGAKKGLRTLPEIEDHVRALIKSLTPDQDKAAKQPKAFPEIKEGQPKADVGAPVGITADKLTAEQKATLVKLLQAYTDRMPEDLAAGEMKRVKATPDAKLFFAYSGSPKPGDPYTYRVQGPEFVVEFLNVQADSAKNPANHIHSAWRRLPIDFGLTE
jgi:Spy/CpxP family protein refolding chaperone